jgi:hypothetical protein
MYKEKRRGDRGHPSLTPFVDAKRINALIGKLSANDSNI